MPPSILSPAGGQEARAYAVVITPLAITAISAERAFGATGQCPLAMRGLASVRRARTSRALYIGPRTLHLFALHSSRLETTRHPLSVDDNEMS